MGVIRAINFFQGNFISGNDSALSYFPKKNYPVDGLDLPGSP
jgi:hypothetical protein